MSKRYFEILLTAGTFGILAVVALLLQFNGLYGQDSHEYLRFAGELRASLLTGSDPGSFFWPVYYPLAGALLSLIVPNLPLVMQGISMVALAAGALFLARSLQILYPGHRPHILIFTGLFFVLSPYIFRSGMVVMSEMFSVFFICGALYYWLKYRPKRQLKDLLFFFGFCCGAVLTRYNALVILFPFLIHAVIVFIRDFKVKHLIWSILLALISLLPQLLINKPMTGSGVHHYLFQGWSFANFLRSNFNLADGHLHYALPNFIYAFQYLFHPGFTVLGIPLFLFLRKKHFQNNPILIITISILLYTIFIMGISNQNVRFLVLVFPLFLVILYPGFSTVMDWMSRWKWLVYPVVGLFILAQSVLINKSMKGVLELNRFEQTLANRLALPDQDLPLYTFSVDLALKTYGLQNPIRNLWYEGMPMPDSAAYVLFNEDQFKNQWAGKSVMINWEKLNDQGNLTSIYEPMEGWKLYKYAAKRPSDP